MDNITTLEDVFNRVDSLSKNCTDKLIPIKAISFDRLDTIKIENEPHKLRPVAQRSMAYRLGIPFQYIERCPVEIQSLNLNYWIKREKNEEMFLRFDGDEVRAIFTPKYKPVDNFEILEKLDSLGVNPDTLVQCYLDAEFMTLSVPDANKTFFIKDGDQLTPGISISNSEVGLASLSISSFILRLVCTNGLISKVKSFAASFRHISTKILDHLPKLLTDVSNRVEGQKKQFQISLESKVNDPISTLNNFNRQFQLGKSEKEAVEWGWGYEAGDTMFNIINAYTKASQYNGLSAESSFNLQSVGGHILELVN
ncbi:MAG: DUF932 domain-containing protein [bacterium]